MNILVDKVFTILRERRIDTEDNFLLRLKPLLLNAGKRIIDSNRRLTERLNRIIVGPEAERSRVLLEKIGAIKKQVLELKERLPEDEGFMTVETDPETYLPLERPLSILQESTQFELPESPEYGSADYSPLLSLFYIDYQLLRKNISDLLKDAYGGSISLESIFSVYPPEKGLAEVIAYLDIASRDPNAQIMDSSFQVLYEFEKTEKRVTIPQVIYSNARTK